MLSKLVLLFATLALIVDCAVLPSTTSKSVVSSTTPKAKVTTTGVKPTEGVKVEEGKNSTETQEHPSNKRPPKYVISTEPAQILSQEQKGTIDGTYQWGFAASDGTKASQAAQAKMVNERLVEDIKGSYSYVDNEGKPHGIQYIANEYGYFPEGPDIFPEIAAHLAYLRAHPQPLRPQIEQEKLSRALKDDETIEDDDDDEKPTTTVKPVKKPVEKTEKPKKS